MRTIVLALAVAAAPAMALACDSPAGSRSATFILREGDTTWLVGSIKDLKRIKSKLRGHGPALFVRLDGKEYWTCPKYTGDLADPRQDLTRLVPVAIPESPPDGPQSSK